MMQQQGPEPMCETSEPGHAPIAMAEVELARANIAWRIHEAFDFRREHEIARILGMSSRSVESCICGREFPTAEMLLQIHAVTGVSLHWILTGKGSRFGATLRLADQSVEDWAELGFA